MTQHLINRLYIICTLLSMAFLIIGPSCSGTRSDMSEDEELRLFNLVAEPSSEGNYALAISMADSLLSTQLSDTLRGYIMLERGVALFNSGKIAESASYGNDIMEYARKHNIIEIETQAEQNRGGIYRRSGNDDSALICYSRGLDLAMKSGNIEMEQVLADMLAILCAERNRFDDAEKFSQQAISLGKEMSDTLAIVSAVATSGAIRARQEKYAEAIRIQEPYIPMAATVDPLTRIKFYTPVVKSCIQLDSLQKARDILSQMQEDASVLPANHQSAIAVKSVEAALASAEKRWDDQWEILCALDSLDTQGRKENMIMIERAECRANMGDWQGAAQRYRKAYDALYEQHRSSVEKDISELSVKYDTALKQLEIERLRSRQWVMMSIISCCIFLIIIGAGVWTVISRSRKAAAERKARMEYIRGLEQERGRMARELHDDVAAHLVGLQFDILTCPVEECAAKLKSLAVKVRNLSHELMPPEFTQLTLPELISDMALSRNDAARNISIQCLLKGSFEWQTLPAATSFELYRIVQEAVTNAIKHTSAPDITITLDGDSRYKITVESTSASTSPHDTQGIGLRIMKIRAELAGATLTNSISQSGSILTLTQL